MSRLRRFKPPEPQSQASMGVYRLLLYFGGSMSIKRERWAGAHRVGDHEVESKSPPRMTQPQSHIIQHLTASDSVTMDSGLKLLLTVLEANLHAHGTLRTRHDAKRRHYANNMLELLLDAAIGGQGDAIDDFAGGYKSAPTLIVGGLKARAGTGARVMEMRPGSRSGRGGGQRGGGWRFALSGPDAAGYVSRPAALPAAGAATAMRAASELIDRGGGGAALLRSSGCVAALLRCSGGSSRPTPVVSRACVVVGGLVARRRLRGTLLR